MYLDRTRPSAALVSLAVCISPRTAAAQDGGAFDLAAAARPPATGPRPVEAIRSDEAPLTRAPRPAAEPRPDAEAPEPPSDFQNSVATSVGRLLPVFGQSLFAAPPSTFAPVDDGVAALTVLRQ